MSILAYCLTRPADAEDAAGGLGIVVSLLSMFAYIGLVVPLTRDPVAREQIFCNPEDSWIDNPYYGLFVVDVVIMYRTLFILPIAPFPWRPRRR